MSVNKHYRVAITRVTYYKVQAESKDAAIHYILTDADPEGAEYATQMTDSYAEEMTQAEVDEGLER